MPIVTVAVSYDNKLIATGSYDHNVIIWDFSSGIVLFTLTKHIA